MNWFIVLVPLWLFGVIFPATVESEYLVWLQFIGFVWLPITAGLVIGGPFLFARLFREHLWILFLTATSLVAMTASALLSEEPQRSLGFVLTAALGLMCCAGIWELLGADVFKCLRIYAIGGTALTIYMYTVGTRVDGRLTIGDAHPNYLGIVAFGLFMCSLTIRPRIVAGAMMALNSFIIVETQSRSALAAVLLGVFVYCALKANQIRKRKSSLVLLAVSLLLMAITLTSYDLAQQSFSSLFFLDDRYRGLGTGFTGRVGAWQEALDLFSSSPFFGVGFRMHERYMTILSSAHNGYLSLLAEVGVIGAIPLFTLVIASSWRLFRRATQGDEPAILGCSFVAGYLLVAAFERLFLNMGNPTSILAWLFLMISDKGSLTYVRQRLPVVPLTPFGLVSAQWTRRVL